MYPAYATKLSFCTRKIDISAQKIERSYLIIFEIVIADCSVMDKLRNIWFFQKTFLLANIGLNVILGMPLLTFSRADVWFAERKFVWKTYTAVETIPMTRKVEIINKTEFVVAALNPDNRIFAVHIAALPELIIILIHPFVRPKSPC